MRKNVSYTTCRHVSHTFNGRTKYSDFEILHFSLRAKKRVFESVHFQKVRQFVVSTALSAHYENGQKSTVTTIVSSEFGKCVFGPNLKTYTLSKYRLKILYIGAVHTLYNTYTTLLREAALINF